MGFYFYLGIALITIGLLVFSFLNGKNMIEKYLFELVKSDCKMIERPKLNINKEHTNTETSNQSNFDRNKNNKPPLVGQGFDQFNGEPSNEKTANPIIVTKEDSQVEAEDFDEYYFQQQAVQIDDVSPNIVVYPDIKTEISNYTAKRNTTKHLTSPNAVKKLSLNSFTTKANNTNISFHNYFNTRMFTRSNDPLSPQQSDFIKLKSNSTPDDSGSNLKINKKKKHVTFSCKDQIFVDTRESNISPKSEDKLINPYIVNKSSFNADRMRDSEKWLVKVEEENDIVPSAANSKKFTPDFRAKPNAEIELIHLDVTNNEKDNNSIKFDKSIKIPEKYKNILEEPTAKDYEEMNFEELVEYDRRKFWPYFWDLLKEDHVLICIWFFKSLMFPRFIRIFIFAFAVDLEFATKCFILL